MSHEEDIQFIGMKTSSSEGALPDIIGLDSSSTSPTSLAFVDNSTINSKIKKNESKQSNQPSIFAYLNSNKFNGRISKESNARTDQGSDLANGLQSKNSSVASKPETIEIDDPHEINDITMTSPTIDKEVLDVQDNDNHNEYDNDSSLLIDSKSQEEYQIWKKNSPYLYDYLQTFSLVWPSLTVQFLPDFEKVEINNISLSENYDRNINEKNDNLNKTKIKPNNKSTKTNNQVFKKKFRLLFGSFSSKVSSEFIHFADFTTSDLSSKFISIEHFDPEKNEFLNSNINNITNSSSSNNNSANYLFKKITVNQKILNKGDINRLIYMPQKPDIISSINDSGKIYLFDRTKHFSKLNSTFEKFKPQMILDYHKTEGYGLSFNHHKEGYLLSASLDGNACLWDIKSTFSLKNNTVDTPLSVVKNSHPGGVNDIKWLYSHDSIYGSVGEDNSIKIFDIRLPVLNDSKRSTPSNNSYHNSGINSLSFNFKNMFCLATADSDGLIAIWDLRDFSKPIYSLKNAHKGSISTIKWNNNLGSILASAGQDDHRVKLWDMAQMNPNNDTSTIKDYDQGFTEPIDDKTFNRELLFIHGGHMSGVNDISWNPNDDWMISSVSNDNSLHVWKPSKSIVE
ncbi:Msi1p [Ascoidea rubescens DSM 1968]|uniref:WD40 repeat-like protein n=1 Tax=Ascoidea rubescens DSM 1968 TaxID=1344418 RepID=A0A1D2VIT8_9ASCO|nr:WD40 repeat-like protein [Ascoidea rubescens DSM 1968]ODV61480.1 WD40 repeat-like protein [Ascoidea rubescens DSM 1968]